MQQQQPYPQHYSYLHYAAILTLRSSNIRNVTQCSSNHTHSITYTYITQQQHPQCYPMQQQQQLYLQHYLYLHYAAILTLRSSNIRNVTQCSSSSYTYSITYTYITQQQHPQCYSMQQQLYPQHHLYLHYAAVTSAMLLNAAAAATIPTAPPTLTLRSYTYIMQQ